MKCEPYTCSPELEAACSPISSSDIIQLPLWNGTLIAAECCVSEPPTDGFRACTCTRSTPGCLIHPNTPAEWIASMRAGLAQIFPWLERERASTARRLASGVRLRGSLASFDPVTCSWRTAQRSLLADSNESSPTWPRSGMTRAGECYPLPTSEPPTSARDGGALRNVPTPTATFNNPQVRGEGCTIGTSRGTTLAGFVRKFPIPTGHYLMPPEGGGLPNQDWCEWLQGWPIRHTAFAPLETGKSRSAPRRRGSRSADRSDTNT